MNVDQALRVAKQKSKQGSLQEAREIYYSIIRRFPKNKKALLEIKSLKESLTNEINENPTPDELQNIISLYNQQKYHNVLAQTKPILKLFPNSEFLYNILGATNLALQQYNLAIEHFKNAIKLSPENAEVHNNIGLAYKGKGETEKALEYYQQAIKIKPNYAEAYYNMGLTYKGKEETEKALECYQQAIKIKPDYIQAHYNIGHILQSKNETDAAIESYKKVLSIKPDYVEAYNNMGVALRDLGKLVEAIYSYKKALSIKPDFVEAYNNLGNSLREQGKLNEAVDCYNSALEIKPDFIQAISNQCSIFEKSNQLKELGNIIFKSKRVFSSLPTDILFYEAIYHNRLKNKQECQKILEGININLLSSKKITGYWNLKAKILDSNKNYQSAFQAFNQMNKSAVEDDKYNEKEANKYFSYLLKRFDQLKKCSENPYEEKITKPLKNQPTFLVGFPRSGTTLLDVILRTHKKISVIEEKPMVNKVIKHLGDDLAITYIERIQEEIITEARNIYLKEFKKHLLDKNEFCMIDKLPLNMTEVPLINKLFPRAKYIFALRHPLDCILSNWMQNFELNASMANMIDLDRVVDFYCVAMDIFELSEKRYSLDVHRIKYEDLVLDYKLEISNLLKFLKLKWVDDLEGYKETALKRGLINTPSYRQVVQPIYTTASFRWKNYRYHLEKYFPKIDKWIKKFGYSI